MNLNLENLVQEAHKDVTRHFDALAPVLEKVLKGAVVSGAAVTGPYVSGRTALDLALIFNDSPGESLAALAGAFKPLAKKGFAPPLVLSQQELTTSLDVFPMEFLAMKQTGTVVAGEFDLDGIPIEKEHLRLQVERELRGLVLHCRMAYLSHASNEAALGRLVASGAGRLGSIFGAASFVLGTTTNVPADLVALVTEKRPRLSGNRLLELAASLDTLVEQIDTQ